MAAPNNCARIEGIQAPKYPARHTFLPHDFCAKATDNERLLGRSVGLYEADGLLQPAAGSLGVNKKSAKISTSMEFGEIYVVWAIGTTIYKIGISSDFRRRFKDLTANSPVPLTVIKYARCDHPHLLEARLHKMFAHLLFKNEWFSLGKRELEEIDAVFDRYFEKTERRDLNGQPHNPHP